MNVIVNNSITIVIISAVLSGIIFLYLFSQLNTRIGVFNLIHTRLSKIQRKKRVIISIMLKSSIVILVGILIINSLPKGIFLGFLLALQDTMFADDLNENIKK